MFKLEFETNSVDFNLETDLVRIMEKILEQLRRGDDFGIVRDFNGNRIGTWTNEEQN